VARSKGESDAVMEKSQARRPYAQAEPVCHQQPAPAIPTGAAPGAAFGAAPKPLYLSISIDKNIIIKRDGPTGPSKWIDGYAREVR
jgi:hypothetical protein